MLHHSWCCSSSVSSWGDSSGQFSLQSFLPASGMPVSQALFQARSFLDISLIPCTETAPAAADAPLRTQPGHHQASACGCTPRSSPTYPSCTQSGKCLSAASPAPMQKARPARGADRAFHGSIKVCGGAGGWPVHPSSGSAARPPTRSVTESPPAYRHRSEEHTSELQSHSDLVCRLLLEKKKTN